MNKIFLIIIFLLIPKLCFAVPATMYVTSAGAGNRDGTDWANAFRGIETGSTDSFENECEANSEAGDIYYVMGGTNYTLTSNMDCDLTNGTPPDSISIIGVTSATTAEPPTSADWAFGTDRPFFTDGGNDYTFELGNAYNLFNTRHSKTGAGHMARTGDHCFLYNVYMIMNSNDNVLWLTGDASKIVSSELTAPTATAAKHLIGLNNTDGQVINCYLHDGAEGVDATTTGVAIVGNVFDNLVIGVDANSDNINISGNTFYDVTTAIDGEGDEVAVFNNLFDECTAPIVWNADEDSNFFGYNSYDGDESGNVNVTETYGSIDTDITLTDPAAGQDFTLPDSSDAEGIGIQMNTNIGTVGDYNVNIGVDQTDTQAGGGGSVTVGYGGLR